MRYSVVLYELDLTDQADCDLKVMEELRSIGFNVPRRGICKPWMRSLTQAAADKTAKKRKWAAGNTTVSRAREGGFGKSET